MDQPLYRYRTIEGQSRIVVIAGVADAIIVGVDLSGIHYQQAVIGLIGNGVAIVIKIRVVTYPVTIRVHRFRGIERKRVGGVQDTVSVIIVVAGVTQTVRIGINLTFAYQQRTVVSRVGGAIAIVVIVAIVAGTVAVGIYPLFDVIRKRINAIGDAVTIAIVFDRKIGIRNRKKTWSEPFTLNRAAATSRSGNATSCDPSFNTLSAR